MKLNFSNFEQLRDHIQLIEAGNYIAEKRWNAEQNFFHLAAAFEGSMTPLPAGYPVLVRVLVRPFRWIVTRYRFPPWLPIPSSIKPMLSPPAVLDFNEQRDRLLNAIDSFMQFSKEHPPHPVLGYLTHEEWKGFHLRHCEHHLSFIKLSSSGRRDSNAG